jgi:hypothetical protein
MYSGVLNGICRILRSPSAAGSLESFDKSADYLFSNPTSSPTDDYLSWLSENCEYDLTQLDELVKDLFSQSNIAKDCDKLVDEMVGTPSEIMESSRLEAPQADNSVLKAESFTSTFLEEKISSTLIQDAWNMTTSTVTHDTHSVPMELLNEEPLIITTPELEITTEDTHSDEILEGMISEEIVITSDDLSLYDACDTIPDISSTCSDADTDERNSDQGYESIDSPVSDTDNSLSELFPELIYDKSELLVY